MSIHSFLSSLRCLLAQSPTCVRWAILVRNQANMVVGKYFSSSSNHKENGEELLIRHVAPQCNIFIDVGANVGDWSRSFLKYAKSDCVGILIEPGQQAAEELRRDFAGDTQVEVLEVAVGSKNGTTNFYEQPSAGEASSLYESFAGRDATERTVECTTLYGIVTERNVNVVDFLKIDTEGHDFRVLKGTQPLLKDRAIKLIQFEYNRPWARAGATLGGAIRLLNAYKYRCYAIREDGLYSFNYHRYHEYFQYSNFIAVSPGAAGMVEPLLAGRI